ncbi:MAG: Holliday junction branch migration protein RuvA [Nitrospirae bacterium]|nr:Holliday junction branch migration protein RuvA [Nitrospirota bacterium]
MIALLTGRLVYKSPEYSIIDVNGVGYHVLTSLNSYYSLPEIGNTLTINIYTHVREDALHLFGFWTKEEKELFHKLLSVSGIGPKLALTILSGKPVEELAAAIIEGDVRGLTAMPGIGKKIADRLILELKDKVQHIAPATEDRKRTEKNRLIDDALSALINLGYNRAIAKDAVEKISGGAGEDVSVEGLIRESLKVLSR